jgi:hypothetical protein
MVRLLSKVVRRRQHLRTTTEYRGRSLPCCRSAARVDAVLSCTYVYQSPTSFQDLSERSLADQCPAGDVRIHLQSQQRDASVDCAAQGHLSYWLFLLPPALDGGEGGDTPPPKVHFSLPVKVGSYPARGEKNVIATWKKNPPCIRPTAHGFHFTFVPSKKVCAPWVCRLAPKGRESTSHCWVSRITILPYSTDVPKRDRS